MTRNAAANSTFAIGGVSFSADSFEVNESAVRRINICAENPAHRKSANRYTQPMAAVLTRTFLQETNRQNR